MQRLVLLISGAVILVAPTSASAVPIHVHDRVPVTHHRVVGKDVDGAIVATWTTMREVVRVEHVPPADRDDDGIADSEDPCVACAPPPPPPAVSEPSAVEPSTAYSAPVASSGAAPSVVQCESGGDYSAATGNGYFGGYQFDSSTWDAYGDPAYGEANEAPPEVQDAAAASVPYDAWPNC